MKIKINTDNIYDKIILPIDSTIAYLEEGITFYNSIIVPSGFDYYSEFVDVGSKLSNSKNNLMKAKDFFADSKNNLNTLDSSYCEIINKTVFDLISKVDNRVKK